MASMGIKHHNYFVGARRFFVDVGNKKSVSLVIVCVVECLDISFNQKQYTGRFHSMGWEKVSQFAEL